MERKIKEVTEKLSSGTITKEEADRVLLGLLVVEKGCTNKLVLEGIEHCFVCTRESCDHWR